MAKEKDQTPSFRLPKQVQMLLEHRADEVREQTERDRPLPQWITAALLEFLKLKPKKQLDLIYKIDETTDALLIQWKLTGALRRAEPGRGGQPRGRTRKASGTE